MSRSSGVVWNILANAWRTRKVMEERFTHAKLAAQAMAFKDGAGLTSRRDQSMPISKAASKSFALVEIMPWLPTPTGIWSKRVAL
ncbi:MAG: hypothetical protein FRX49_08191 [Trebouxia sp. A1-2]|nr:MAG: hypothetical protein FRX49_08191 [Trebouxia sp. A1-2]